MCGASALWWWTPSHLSYRGVQVLTFAECWLLGSLESAEKLHHHFHVESEAELFVSGSENMRSFLYVSVDSAAMLCWHVNVSQKNIHTTGSGQSNDCPSKVKYHTGTEPIWIIISPLQFQCSGFAMLVDQNKLAPYRSFNDVSLGKQG